ncbi:unnamed protein product [Microthlaspi erraticum]|uniref:Pollen Ole e 1 allergen and extensin family protein n=1 Tax=Microthlaspi erraticum TaxID=1685480 RepID=A0A6D2J9G3_9BRAS|nr:unnamed protein product [Microthlaspi erraticum]
MARSNVYLIYILLIMASLSPPSHGFSFAGLKIGRIVIEGVVYCNLDGNSQGAPVSNATILLQCCGSTTSLAQAVTNPNGTFTIVLNVLETLLFSESLCLFSLNLPAGNCILPVPDGVLSATFILSATFTLLKILLTNTTNIAVFLAGPFLDGIF